MKKRTYVKAICMQCVQNFFDFVILRTVLHEKKRGVELVRSISYGKKGEENFDLIYKEGKTEDSPVFFYIHGGGWLSGRKNQRRYYCYEYAREGYAAVNVGYTYAPQKQHPFQLQEIFTAIEKIIDNSVAYKISPLRQFVIAGESAGAHLASFVAAIAANDLYDKFGIQFKYKEQFKVHACVLICGLYDVRTGVDLPFPHIKLCMEAYTGLSVDELREGKGDFSPLDYVNEKFPPSFVVMAQLDALRPQSSQLIAKLMEKGVKCRFYLGTGELSGHAFPLCNKTRKGRICVDRILSFLEEAESERVEKKQERKKTRRNPI